MKAKMNLKSEVYSMMSNFFAERDLNHNERFSKREVEEAFSWFMDKYFEDLDMVVRQVEHEGILDKDDVEGIIEDMNASGQNLANTDSDAYEALMEVIEDMELEGVVNPDEVLFNLYK